MSMGTFLIYFPTPNFLAEVLFLNKLCRKTTKQGLNILWCHRKLY